MKLPNGNNLIFFTDLDGTLLDHETYSYEPAREALSALRASAIPLIMASSKTAAEIQHLRNKLELQSCEAIIENGAGIVPADQQINLSGSTYHSLLEKLSEVPSKYRDKFRGFSQMSNEELVRLTGLKDAQAANAKNRQFSEPGLWHGSEEELQNFRSTLEQLGIILQTGGRFLTLSFGGNKVDRMQDVLAEYHSNGSDRFSVALGDAPNDIAMLEAADLGIIVNNPSHAGIKKLIGEENGAVWRTKRTGPAGWNSAVLKVLNEAGLGG